MSNFILFFKVSSREVLMILKFYSIFIRDLHQRTFSSTILEDFDPMKKKMSLTRWKLLASFFSSPPLSSIVKAYDTLTHIGVQYRHI